MNRLEIWNPYMRAVCTSGRRLESARTTWCAGGGRDRGQIHERCRVTAGLAVMRLCIQRCRTADRPVYACILPFTSYRNVADQLCSMLLRLLYSVLRDSVSSFVRFFSLLQQSFRHCYQFPTNNRESRNVVIKFSHMHKDQQNLYQVIHRIHPI